MADNPKNLANLYAILDGDHLTASSSHSIAALLRQLESSKDITEEDRAAISIEMRVQYLTVEKGIVRSPILVNEKGNRFDLLPLESLDSQFQSYLALRLRQTSSPILKARYAHILWFVGKHNDHARIATESYLQATKLLEEFDTSKPDGFYGLAVLSSVENAFAIAKMSRVNLEQVKEEILRLLCDYSSNSQSKFVITAQLSELATANRKLFGDEEIGRICALCWSLQESLSTKGQFQNAITVLEIGQKLLHQLTRDSAPWFSEIGSLYERLITSSPEGIGRLFFCQFAIQNYRRAKNESKVTKLLSEYERISASTKLAEISVPIDMAPVVEEADRFAKLVARKLQPVEILLFLASEKDLLPRYDELVASSKLDIHQHSFARLLATSVLDQQGNTAEHFSTDEEKDFFEILKQYQIELVFKLIRIGRLMMECIIQGKFSFEEVVSYLMEHTWLGKNLTKRFPSGKVLEYNWLQQIGPSLSEFFAQVEAHIDVSRAYRPSVILCVDSMTMKIEGLFRDIFTLKGVPVVYQTTDHKGRTITREKDLNALLREEAIADLFDKDDVLFFRYLFVEQSGMNLRNRVAHSLLRTSEYSVEVVNLLLLAILRIGKYDFVPERPPI